MFIPVMVMQTKIRIDYRMMTFSLPISYIIFSQIKERILYKRKIVDRIFTLGINIDFM